MVRFSLKRVIAFKLPLHRGAGFVMVAAGTGLAPFLASCRCDGSRAPSHVADPSSVTLRLQSSVTPGVEVRRHVNQAAHAGAPTLARGVYPLHDAEAPCSSVSDGLS